VDYSNLILPHEAAVAFDIGTEDGNEFTFNFLYGHGIPQRLVARVVNPYGMIRVY
jgi:hypothetical protein